MKVRRREVLVGALGGAVTLACAGAQRADEPPTVDVAASLADIEARLGGRVGVYVADARTGRWMGRRVDERFAMCSTFKWLLVAACLARVDRGELSLSDRVTFGEEDLLEHAPLTREHVTAGSLSLEELAEGAVVVSDNTAANLLLSRIGGPPGLTQFARAQGDPVTRLDRSEPALNENLASDPRDTTSPRAMGELLRRVVLGDVLSHQSRQRLLGWMRESETGKRRLRAGLPSEWRTGDKTGSCGRGAVNDVAITFPMGDAPFIVAAFTSDSTAPLDDLEAAHAEIGRLVARFVSRRA